MINKQLNKKLSFAKDNFSGVQMKRIETPKQILEMIKKKPPKQKQLTKFVEKGLVMKRNRKTIVINGLKVSESRYIWEKYNGTIPKGMFIHHINGNGFDNRIENLQMVTRKEHGKIHRETRRIHSK